MNENLIDELILSIHPIILGKGIPLFNGITTKHNLKLIDVTKYNSGLVQMSYKIEFVV